MTCAVPLSAAELDVHSHFCRLTITLAPFSCAQTNATFSFSTNTMRYPFPLDDRNSRVPPPSVIHAVTGPQMSVSELRETVWEGTANSTSGSRAGYVSSGSFLNEKLLHVCQSVRRPKWHNYKAVGHFHWNSMRNQTDTFWSSLKSDNNDGLLHKLLQASTIAS